MAIGIIDAPNDKRHTQRVPPGYRLALLVSFAIFFTVALATRLMPWRWQAFGGEGSKYRSIIEEARARTYATVPYAFMM